MIVARAPAAWPSCEAMSVNELGMIVFYPVGEHHCLLRKVAVDLVAQRAFPGTPDRGVQRQRGYQDHRDEGEQKLEEDPILSLRSLEAVARSTHGFQVARIFRVRLDLLANAAHINIHRTRCDVGVSRQTESSNWSRVKTRPTWRAK